MNVPNTMPKGNKILSIAVLLLMVLSTMTALAVIIASPSGTPEDEVNVDGTRAYSVVWPADWGTPLPLEASRSPAAHVNMLEFYMQYDSDFIYYRIILEADYVPNSDTGQTGSTISVVMNDADIDIVEIPDFGFIVFELGLSTYFDDTAIDDPLTTTKDERVMAAPYYWDDVDITSNINPETPDGPYWRQAVDPSSDLIEINGDMDTGLSGVQMAFPMNALPDGFNEDTGRDTPDYSEFNWQLGTGGWLYGGSSSIWENMMEFHPVKPTVQFVDWYEDNYIAGALDDWIMLYEVIPPCEVVPITATINNAPQDNYDGTTGYYYLSGSYTGARYWFESAQVDWGDNYDPTTGDPIMENLNYDLDTETFNLDHTYANLEQAYTATVVINFYCGAGEATIELIPPSTSSSVPYIDATATYCEEFVEEGTECDGKVDYLQFEYSGDFTDVITVYQKKITEPIFSGDLVATDGKFSIYGSSLDNQDTLGTEITIVATNIAGEVLETHYVHTSCSKPIWITQVIGSFTIIDGTSRNGGLLTNYPYERTKGGIAPINIEETPFLLGGDDDDDEVDNPAPSTATSTRSSTYDVDVSFNVYDVEVQTIYVWILWDTAAFLEPDFETNYLAYFDAALPYDTVDTNGYPHPTITGLTVYAFEGTLQHNYYGALPAGIYIRVTEENTLVLDEEGPTESLIHGEEITLGDDCTPPPPPIPEGECDGKVTELTLKYTGDESADIVVAQKKDGIKVFEGFIDPSAIGFEEDDRIFTFSGLDKDGTLGTEIIIYVNGFEYTRIHTSCSKPIGPGLIMGDFEVLSGLSRNGGVLPPVAEDGQVYDSGTDPDPIPDPNNDDDCGDPHHGHKHHECELDEDDDDEVEYKVDYKFKDRMIKYKDAKPKLTQGQTDTFVIEVKHKKKSDPELSVMIEDSKKKGKNDWETLDLEEGESVEMENGFIVTILSKTEVKKDTYSYEITVYGDSNDNDLKEISFLFEKGAKIKSPSEKKVTIERETQ